MTFYTETVIAITGSNHTENDVTFVGKSNGSIGCGWVDFINTSRFMYDSGYGSQEIDSSLIVQFSDGTYLERREYDGSEWWEYVGKMPQHTVNESNFGLLKRQTKYEFINEYVMVKGSNQIDQGEN